MTRIARSALVVAALAGCSANIRGSNGGGSSNGSNGNGNNNGNNGPDATCPDVSFTAQRVTPSIQLLIDRSGSMRSPFGFTTRYGAIQNALVGANGVVTQLQSSVYFGASLFTDDAPCPTLYSKPRALNNESAIAALIASQGPGGNTPTQQSIALAVQNFMANPPPQGSPPAIVLATDGLPNSCNSTADTSAQTVQAVQAAFTAGIRLYIIGIAGVATQFLQDVANAGTGVPAGGSAMYYTSNSPASMTAAFQSIIGGVLSCDLTINGTIDPNQASSGMVTLDGMQLTYGTDWTVVNGNTLELLGAACTTLKTAANPTVTATFSCGAVVQ
jgi:hypothetical protein